jgi:hypothetical protein
VNNGEDARIAAMTKASGELLNLAPNW